MTLFGLNQLWAADITYIRLASEFVYLAVVLDVFSRKVIGWALWRSLKSQLPLCALKRAIANRRPSPGVVHHSDQGVQYACQECVAKLRDHQMLPSMSRPSNPYDNATCASFLKTLKREEIYAGVYRDLGDLSQGVEENSSSDTTTLVGYIRRWARQSTTRELSHGGSKQNVRCGYASGKCFTSACATGLLEVIRSFRVTYNHGHHPRSGRRDR